MANIERYAGLDTYTIRAEDGVTQATLVPALGGALSSILMAGPTGARELLFQHDHFWDPELSRLPGGWPFCFPVCGRLTRNQQVGEYLLNKQRYQLPIHGFAWQVAWTVVDHGEDHLLLELRDTPFTRAMYPFRFILQLHYSVQPNVIICRQTYHNPDDHPLPYAAGFHPYFLTPPIGQGKEQVILNYAPIRCWEYNSQLTDIVGSKSLFHVPVAITDPRINEQLTELGDNHEISLRFPDGVVIHCEVTGVEDPHLFPYLQLYTIPDRPFICVEPWMAVPNALNSAQGMRWLVPQQSEHGVLRLWLEQ